MSLKKVTKYEHIVKDGEDYSAIFRWEDDDNTETQIVRRTVQDAIDKYLTFKEFRNQRKSTIDRSRVGLKSLTDTLTKNRAVSTLNDDDIAYIEEQGGKNEKEIRQVLVEIMITTRNQTPITTGVNLKNEKEIRVRRIGHEH